VLVTTFVAQLLRFAKAACSRTFAREHDTDGDRAHEEEATKMARSNQKTPEAWLRVERALGSQLVRIAFIWGPPGIGKTYAAFQYGRVAAGLYSVTITEETSAAELRGHYLFKGAEAVWHDGPMILAFREGKRLVINEISHANGDVLNLMWPLLESWETAQLTLPTGETVRPQPGFHVVVTDNCPPDDLPAPLQDRFTVLLPVEHPHPAALSSLSGQLRELAEAGASIGEDDRRISARRWQALSTLSEEFGLREACLLTFGPARGAMAFDAITLALAARKRGR
jgi:MoxR-like ATPase